MSKASVVAEAKAKIKAVLKDLEAELDEKRKTATGFERDVLETIGFSRCGDSISYDCAIPPIYLYLNQRTFLEPIQIGVRPNISKGAMIKAALKARDDACLRIKELILEYNKEIEPLKKQAQTRAISMLEAHGLTSEYSSLFGFKKKRTGTKRNAKKQRTAE